MPHKSQQINHYAIWLLKFSIKNYIKHPSFNHLNTYKDRLTPPKKVFHNVDNFLKFVQM